MGESKQSGQRRCVLAPQCRPRRAIVSKRRKNKMAAAAADNSRRSACKGWPSEECIEEVRVSKACRSLFASLEQRRTHNPGIGNHRVQLDFSLKKHFGSFPTRCQIAQVKGQEFKFGSRNFGTDRLHGHLGSTFRSAKHANERQWVSVVCSRDKTWRTH